jgi:hypothetical protein
MLIQKLARFLAYHKVTRITPFDLYHWYGGRIEFTFTGNIWSGDPEMPLAPRGCLVHKKVGKIISAFEKPGPVIYDDNIMDRFWQRGKLMLVTRDFKVFDEATTRIHRRGCQFCGTVDQPLLTRLTGTCARCNTEYNPLWTCRRTIMNGRYRAHYDPITGKILYLGGRHAYSV